MIDYSNEVFDHVARNLRLSYPGIYIKGEYEDSPTRFPGVTVDEISNVPKYMDSAQEVKYATVVYRVQVFCNGEGKRAKAREIYKAVDDLMVGVGLLCKTYTSTPSIYNAEIYSITATYSGVIDINGVIYRR